MDHHKYCPGCQYCFKLTRYNPEKDWERIEQQYRLTGDPHLLITLNQHRLSAGLPPIEVEKDLDSWQQYLNKFGPTVSIADLQKLLRAVESIDNLQFEAYLVRDIPAIQLRYLAETYGRDKNFAGLLVQSPRQQRRLSDEELALDPIPEPDIGPIIDNHRPANLYLVPKTIFQLSGDPIDRSSLQSDDRIVADMWMRWEDPLTLTYPERRRGSYPSKIILVQRPDQRMISGYLKHTEDNYITWMYTMPYDRGKPSLGTGYLNHGNYDMPLDEARIDYLCRVLKLASFSGDDRVFQLLY